MRKVPFDARRLRLEGEASPEHPALVPLQPDDERHLAAAAYLHHQALPESPVPRLGDHFMRRFYYPELSRSELIHCVFCAHRGHIVGFTVSTDRPNDFLGVGLRRHPFALAWAVARAVATRPSRLRVVWEVLADKRSRSRRDPGEKVGELLTVAVVPEYRGRPLGEPYGSVGRMVLQHQIDYLASRGVTRAQTITKRDNLRARGFYEKHGFELVDPDVGRDSCLLTKSIERND